MHWKVGVLFWGGYLFILIKVNTDHFETILFGALRWISMKKLEFDCHVQLHHHQRCFTTRDTRHGPIWRGMHGRDPGDVLAVHPPLLERSQILAVDDRGEIHQSHGTIWQARCFRQSHGGNVMGTMGTMGTMGMWSVWDPKIMGILRHCGSPESEPGDGNGRLQIVTSDHHLEMSKQHSHQPKDGKSKEVSKFRKPGVNPIPILNITH